MRIPKITLFVDDDVDSEPEVIVARYTNEPTVEEDTKKKKKKKKKKLKTGDGWVSKEVLFIRLVTYKRLNKMFSYHPHNIFHLIDGEDKEK